MIFSQIIRYCVLEKAHWNPLETVVLIKQLFAYNQIRPG